MIMNLPLPSCDWLVFWSTQIVKYDAEGELGRRISDYVTVYSSYCGCYWPFYHPCFMSRWQTYWGIDEMCCTCYASCSLWCVTFLKFSVVWTSVGGNYYEIFSLCLWSLRDMYDTTLNYSSYFVFVQYFILLVCENVYSIC